MASSLAKAITTSSPATTLLFSSSGHHLHHPQFVHYSSTSLRRISCKSAEVSNVDVEGGSTSPQSSVEVDGGGDGKNWVPVVPLSALPKGERRVILQDGEAILLMWYKDEIYAIENRSPAEGAYSEGLLNARLTQDGCIICPSTESTFDLKTGEVKEWYPKNPVLRVLTPSLRNLFVYSVKTDDENIYIGLGGGGRSEGISAEIVFSGQAQPGLTSTDVNVEEVRMVVDEGVGGHAGDKWCIYPSYDYAHCIVDSLENISHSLCTLEFEIRRASYYWLLEALDLYHPYVWEYSRLNISNNVLSKRKLNRLATENLVDGWDDPRLLTLAGLRRRGVSSDAINDFIRGIGITRSDNSMIQLNRLEYHIREDLNKAASRTMVVLHPLKIVITNLADGAILDLDAKMWPDANNDDRSSFYKVPFTNTVYVESSDFRTKDSKDYYGLAPGKSVLLRYAFPIKCTEVIYGDDGKSIMEIRAEYDPSKKTKPKGVLHWVAQPSPGVDPLKVEVRLFEKLFLSEDPTELGDKWLSDINPHSKEVIKDAYAVPTLASAVLGDKFQFERLGYFAVDKDSTPGKLVFNRTVTLRDSYSKGGSK